MLGVKKYERLDDIHELTDRKDPSVNVRGVGDENRNEDVHPILTQQPTAYWDSPATPQWPSQPGTLVEDPRWELMYDLYDSFLIVIAVVLLVKTSLCIYAFDLDKYNRAKFLDAVSPLTLKLIRFNEQVSHTRVVGDGAEQRYPGAASVLQCILLRRLWMFC